MIRIKKCFKDKTFFRYRIINQYIFIFIYIGLISLYSCSTLPPVVIPIEPENVDNSQSLDEKGKDINTDIENNLELDITKDGLDDLSIFKSHLVDDDENKVEDILLSLEAEIEFNKTNYEASEKLWYKALTITDSDLSKLYFKGWILSVLLRKRVNDSLTEFSSKILEVTNKGKKFPYLVKHKLNTVDKIEGFIQLVLDLPFLSNKSYSFINKDVEEKDSGNNSISTKKKVSANLFNIKKDPSLKEAKDLYCNKKMDISHYEKNLDKYIKTYWNGIKYSCDKNNDKAIKSFSYILKKYLELDAANIKTAKNNKTKNAKNKNNKTTNKQNNTELQIPRSVALYSGYNLIDLYRKKGSRLYMSYAYSFIIRLYESGLDKKDLNMNPIKFYEQKINDYLWTARYLAIVKDYPGAKKICDRVSEIFKEFRSKNKNLSLKDRKTFASLEAEKYTVLSGRIYIEEKKYKEAISSIEQIKKIKDLPSPWKERIYWNLALFYYLDQDYTNSILNLKVLLSFVKKEEYSYQKYLYWISKVYEDIGSIEESDSYKNVLIEKYPLSFYSIYLYYDKNLNTKNKNNNNKDNKNIDYLKNMITYENNISSYLIDSKGYDLNIIYSDKKASFFLRRLELILLSSLDRYYKQSSSEFYSYFKNKYLISKKTFSAYLFISKLLTASQDHIGAIYLLTNLSKFDSDLWSKYPEYIFTYYPKPFLNTYTKEAKKRNMDLSIPLAISRQESSFRKKVKSFAGALGIMQIMPETGLKLVNDIKKDLRGKNIEEVLFQVEDNIELGTYYLSKLNRYYKNNVYSVFSAYNAGEYMTDLWLEKRYNKDPIIWIETIPFEESKEYVKSVWKNMIIYNHILQLKKIEMTTFDIHNKNVNINDSNSNVNVSPNISTSTEPGTNTEKVNN